MVNQDKNIIKKVQDFNSLQKSTHYRVTWEILQKIKSVRTTLIACAACVFITYSATIYQIVGLQHSCESSKNLKEAELRILTLEKENEQLVNQDKDNIFLHLRNVNQMTLEERAKLRSDYMEWEQLSAVYGPKENKIMFEEIISGLPDETRAQWVLFQEQSLINQKNSHTDN